MTSREVCLDGGSPWGFRMHGGVDVNQPLRISRVREIPNQKNQNTVYYYVKAHTHIHSLILETLE